MSLFSEELLKKLEDAKIVAGFSVEKVEDAVPLAQALYKGGIRVIELTLRTEVGLEGLKEICKEVPEIIAGVGTILTPEQVFQVKEAGADFGVAPGMNPRVIRAAKEAGLPFAPGIATPSDVEAALEEGCRLVKLFPAESLGGIPYLKSMSTPYKHLGVQYFPLGGVNEANMLDYLKEDNVPIVGGSWIVQQGLVEAKDWKGIEKRAREVVSRL